MWTILLVVYLSGHVSYPPAPSSAAITATKVGEYASLSVCNKIAVQMKQAQIAKARQTGVDYAISAQCVQIKD